MTASRQQDVSAFVLTRHWRDNADGLQLEYWVLTDSGPCRLVFDQQEAVCFIRQQDLPRLQEPWPCPVEVRPLALCDLSGEPVVGLYFRLWRDLRQARDWLAAHAVPVYEGDIRPVDRLLMERFITGSLQVRGNWQNKGGYPVCHNPAVRAGDYRPRLRLLSLDIETAMEGVELYCIGIYAEGDSGAERRVFMVGVDSGDGPGWVHYGADARAVLEAFLAWLSAYDPDVFIGWNVVNFDLWFLQRLADQLGVPLRLGRARQTCHWVTLDEGGDRRTVEIPGRVVLDGIEVLKTAGYRFESFSLQSVSDHLLGEGKLLTGSHRGQAISDLFFHDKVALAEYNLQDCKLVWQIFAQEKLLDFALARSHLTGLALDRLGGSVAAFDYQYLPRLHRRGYVASPQPFPVAERLSPGGYVFDSRPGLYRHVLVFDFKSLYPSIIRTFHIDPLALAVALRQQGRANDVEAIPGFRGALFSRTEHLLPAIIADLWAERDKAKAEHNSALSQAIKIIMNSFYGVLGSQGCRFFDPRLASSITLRGHDIICRSRDWIEDQGYPVIYGDTDSLFVWLKGCEDDTDADRIGRQLARSLNQWWRQQLHAQFGVESVLEIQFETHYRRFLMPTVRGSEKGSKKRYAGLLVKGSEERLVFKGLENVRTDWTGLARRVQSELYARIFHDQPYESFLRQVTVDLAQGRCDHELVYRKRLRQRLGDYQKNIPPHVQAVSRSVMLGQIPAAAVPVGDWVEYVMTVAGPQLLAWQDAPLDYEHYRERQLAPVVDGVLHFFEQSLDNLLNGQLSMF